MESIDEYRRKVLRRTYRKDLRIFAVTVAVLALLLVLAVVLPPIYALFVLDSFDLIHDPISADV